ncbi:hypothetical protein PLICRDRAFT_42727 [Plicaturopsis crispa FD-325 SS-3]|nr:hypothetical protein PLICRDRAFT_42727 [Plicaturopsis crispa FD-325 SS-3]
MSQLSRASHPYSMPAPIRGRGRGRGLSFPRGRSVRGVHTYTSLRSVPSAAFGETLQSITTIKLQELDKQRMLYERHAKVIEEAAIVGETDAVRKVEILLDAVGSWSGSGALDASTLSAIGSKLHLSNMDVWLLQAKKDPSFSKEVLRSWADTLEAHIRYSLARFESATLFGRLFNEWMSSGDSVTTAMLKGKEGSIATGTFVEVGRKEAHEQTERLSSIIFEPADVDLEALTSYLTDLFSGNVNLKALHDMREEIGIFADTLQRSKITASDVSWAIDALFASELMDENKRTTLREFCENPTVLEEVASVLTMRLVGLDTWAWPTDGIVVEMRRHLNGKYRAFTDPDILDALFLTYIGCRWQVKFKEAFRQVFASEAWQPSLPSLSEQELGRRSYFCNETPASMRTIEARRKLLRGSQFLAGQLRDTVHSTPVYDGSEASTTKSERPVTEILLHHMTTECLLNKAIHGQHTIVCSDLEWFGPSLPHESILTILEFFGIPNRWLNFFQTFLEAPLRFKDDPEGSVRVRKRGTPISYALSALFGELVLFVVDFAVNQRADGLFLYRIHDDIWFWNANPDKCTRAWEEINRYASIVGLKINTSKTGSACVGSMLDPRLPTGDVRWGFLRFSPAAARFIIDQQYVDKHIAELRRQLSATKSVFGWVNAYNKYMAFFRRNFGGTPASCLGRVHVDDIIDTLARIQRELFDSADGAVGHLRRVIGERFGAHNLPEGWFYTAIGNGGLELHNPMIAPLAIRQGVLGDPENAFAREMELDMLRYEDMRKKWLSSTTRSPGHPPASVPRPLFMSFEEYTSASTSTARETRLLGWDVCYQSLLNVPDERRVDLPPTLHIAAYKAHSMDYYDRWVVALYGDELMARFGGLEIVDPSLIPVGLVEL